MARRRNSLVVVTPWFPPARGGWPFPFVAQSCLALAARGWRVRVLVVRPLKPAWLAAALGSHVEPPIDTTTFPEIEEIETLATISFPRQLLAPLANAQLDRTLRRHVRLRPELMAGADAVLVHTEGLAPAVLPLCRAFAKPATVVIHGLNTSTSFLHAPGQRARIAPALAAADRVVLVGEPLRQVFTSYMGRADHVRIVPNGIDIPAAPPVSILRQGRPVRLIAVANLQEGKGIDLAVRALARLRDDGLHDWSFRIVGDGPERGALEHLVGTLGLDAQVAFDGAVAHAQALVRLADADVFVLPSYREAFGIAYLEAMAAGLLAVGVRGQGPAQFIRHGETGLLVEPRSVDAVAQALRPLLQGGGEPFRSIAAAGAREARQAWSWEHHARSLQAVLGETMGAVRMPEAARRLP